MDYAMKFQFLHYSIHASCMFEKEMASSCCILTHAFQCDNSILVFVKLFRKEYQYEQTVLEFIYHLVWKWSILHNIIVSHVS